MRPIKVTCWSSWFQNRLGYRGSVPRKRTLVGRVSIAILGCEYLRQQVQGRNLGNLSLEVHVRTDDTLGLLDVDERLGQPGEVALKQTGGVMKPREW